MSVTTHTSKLDFNGDGHTDILWRNSDGDYGVWYLSADGKGILGLEALPNPNPVTVPGTVPPETNNFEIRTFLTAGRTEILWQDMAGRLAVWNWWNGDAITNHYLTLYGITSAVRGSGDFNGDGSDDMLLFNPPSQASPDGSWSSGTPDARKIPPQGVGQLDHAISIDWQFQGVGDFNADGKDDLLFRGGGNATVGALLIEEINNPPGSTGQMKGVDLGLGGPTPDWSVAKLADFNGDGCADILWQHDNGTPGIWLMRDNQVLAMVAEPNPTAFWSIVDAQDYNNDGKADILWRGQDGSVGIWFMDGTTIADLGTSLPNPGTAWSPLGI